MSLVTNAFTESWGIAGMTLSYRQLFRQHQLQLHGHVARYPEADPACRVVSESNNPACRRKSGPPQSSWLGQVDASCRDAFYCVF